MPEWLRAVLDLAALLFALRVFDSLLVRAISAALLWLVRRDDFPRRRRRRPPPAGVP